MGRRLSVDEVVDVFRATGIKPIKGHYVTYLDGPACCAAGVMRYYWTSSHTEESVSIIFQKMGYSGAYLSGLIRGFDGVAPIDCGDPEYENGYNDGKEIAKRVFEAVDG